MCCSVRSLVLGFPLPHLVLRCAARERRGTPIEAEVYITYLECKEEKTEKFDPCRDSTLTFYSDRSIRKLDLPFRTGVQRVAKSYARHVCWGEKGKWVSRPMYSICGA